MFTNSQEENDTALIDNLINLLEGHYKISELDDENLNIGKDFDKCFVIKKGYVLARNSIGQTQTIGPGDPIGFCEACLSKPYQLQYMIKEPTQVFTFSAYDVRKKIGFSSALSRGVIKYSLDRVFESKKSNTYHLIDDNFLSIQNPPFPIKDYQNGELIFMKGQIPRFFFYVLSGRVTVFDKLEEVIFEYSSGDSFGEMAILTGNVRTATARSVGETSLQLVSSEFLTDYLTKEDPLVRLALVSILQRLKSMNHLRQILK
ncbi:MAG: cyclic nucleotide-binding domain-containing protein [Paracoccaceae bacterium]|jgi:CRP-like cAMP-binding protein